MNPVFVFIPNLIGYSRIVFALASLLLMSEHPHYAIILYTLSCLLDALDGYTARKYNQSSQFGAVLDMVTDRCTTSCLLIHLATMYPPYMFIFQILLSLDLSSHYMHMVSNLRQGKDSHKQMDNTMPWLMILYYTNKTVLFLVCAGNELFFIFLYCAGWSSLWTVKLGLLLSFPVCAFKQLMNLIQLKEASVSLANTDLINYQKQK